MLRILEEEDGAARWRRLDERIHKLFGSRLDKPKYIAERGEISMTYRPHDDLRLDLSACGRGQQQTMLLLAHMAANPGSVLLLDEPDAHLEILRQRQIYQVLSETADETCSQIIAASHSEVMLNEAAGRDVLIAFVGKPHRLDNRGSQVAKALKDIGFEHYVQAEKTGWVLYLEGATDLAILLALARRLDHSAVELLEAPYVHYVANQPRKAREHFHGLREAKPDLSGIAIYDRLESPPQVDPNLPQLMWRQPRAGELSLQARGVAGLRCTAKACVMGEHCSPPNGGHTWRSASTRLSVRSNTLGGPSPWGPDIKASDDFLDPLFKRFYEQANSPALIRKTDYHRLADFLKPEDIDPEIIEKLDAIVDAAQRAGEGGG